MPKRILVAEDQMATREALTKLAALGGYDVVAVTDGVELLVAAGKERFDLIITDLIMPELNGASAAEIMQFQGNKTPVIALTGLTHSDLRLVDTKFSRVFHKPANIDEMFQYIESILEKSDAPGGSAGIIQ